MKFSRFKLGYSYSLSMSRVRNYNSGTHQIGLGWILL
ncbi:type IX secretion system membrane protein PorP/SprF [Bacteroidetes bacterium endosymbiont of Geopemphigus sp.]